MVRQETEKQDSLLGAKSLPEFAQRSLSGGTIFPGDPKCALLHEGLVRNMIDSNQGVRYDMRGTIIGKVPIPNGKAGGDQPPTLSRLSHLEQLNIARMLRDTNPWDY